MHQEKDKWKIFDIKDLSGENPETFGMEVHKCLDKIWKDKNLKRSEGSSSILQALGEILKYATDHMSKFQPINLSLTLHRLAKITQERQSGLDALDSGILSDFYIAWFKKANNVMQKFNAQGLSNSIWALNNLRESDLLNKELMEEFVCNWITRADSQLQNFNLLDCGESIEAMSCIVKAAKKDEPYPLLPAFTSPWIIKAESWISRAEERRGEIIRSASKNVDNSQGVVDSSNKSIDDQDVNTELSSTKLESPMAFSSIPK